jgi:phosphate transport system substrate-binding protein
VKVWIQARAANGKPVSSNPDSSRKIRLLHLALIGFALHTILALCVGAGWSQSAVVLVGSGSSVPAPLYSRWAQELARKNSKMHMRYVPVGTSEGIKEISRGTSDFGAGEALLSSAESAQGKLIALPTVLIGIVPIYNLAEAHGELRLSGEALAGIFLGEVKTWDASAIAKLNPELNLPHQRIQVVNRPGGKGS